jgi:uncharacterized protein with PhoU and TrkA domain
MKRKHRGPQIGAKLRQADVLLGRGKSVAEACKELDISEHT